MPVAWSLRGALAGVTEPAVLTHVAEAAKQVTVGVNLGTTHLDALDYLISTSSYYGLVTTPLADQAINPQIVTTRRTGADLPLQHRLEAATRGACGQTGPPESSRS